MRPINYIKYSTPACRTLKFFKAAPVFFQLGIWAIVAEIQYTVAGGRFVEREHMTLVTYLA
jgi:hypothetical protein